MAHQKMRRKREILRESEQSETADSPVTSADGLGASDSPADAPSASNAITVKFSLIANIAADFGLSIILGVTGGFNFQNAWSGGYIAGTSIGELAVEDTQYISSFCTSAWMCMCN